MIKAEIHSDGGGTKESTSGAGAIVRIDGHEERFVAFLGGATNNEAEIFASLLGFAHLFCLKQQTGEAISVHWVADSEYLLKSATAYIHGWQKNGWMTSQKKPVKNQGMWQAYLALTEGFSITPEHVYGHSGHPENEACDSASTWAREFGALASKDGSKTVDVSSSSWGQNWRYVDGRNYLAKLRAETRSNSEVLELAAILSGKPVSVEVQPSLFAEAPLPAVAELDGYLSSLKDVLARIEGASSADKQLLSLKKKLKTLIGSFK